MSLLNPNGLPDRQLIKTAVFGALHNAKDSQKEDLNCFSAVSLSSLKKTLMDVFVICFYIVKVMLYQYL